MRKQSILENRFKALTYTASESVNINDFSYGFKKNLTCPQIESPHKILLPEEKTIFKNFVLIKVEGCGICGTDVHMYYGKRFLDEKATDDNLIIPGHEIFGKVVLAQDEFDYLIDKDVVIDPIIDCYGEEKCRFCDMNKNYMHTPFREMGICGKVPGGFSEYTVGLAKNCLKIEDLSSKHKALIEPLATLMYAFNNVLNITSAPEKYVIIGSGTAGLLALQYLKILNRDNYIVLLDKNDFKLNLSKRLGADMTICTEGLKKNEIISTLVNMTNGRGFENILELSGSDEAIDLIPFVASRLASVLLYGLGHKKVCIENFDMIIEKEIKLYPSLGASDNKSFKKAIKIISDFNVEEIISHEYRGLDKIEKVVRRDCFDRTYIKGVLLV